MPNVECDSFLLVTIAWGSKDHDNQRRQPPECSSRRQAVSVACRHNVDGRTDCADPVVYADGAKSVASPLAQMGSSTSVLVTVRVFTSPTMAKPEPRPIPAATHLSVLAAAKPLLR